MNYLLLILSLCLLSGCSRTVQHTSNACDILYQSPNWYRYHKHFAARSGVEISTVMAFIAKESAFEQHARPVKSWLIPQLVVWEYASSSYGYSQATKGTWQSFQKAYPYANYSREDYPSSVAFISWYLHHHAQSVAKDDIYTQYLKYHDGPRMKLHKVNASTKAYAMQVQHQARVYARQLASCTRSLDWYADWQPLS